jgi:hypothetical protein
MIDFRYHIVSLVAVFLALATGILLGAGPLQEPIQGQLEGRAEALRDDQQQLREANSELQARVDLGEGFTAEVAADLVQSRLTGRRVVIITLAGVDDALREPTEASLASAGAVVSGRVGIEPDLYEPDRLTEVGEVIDALAIPAPDAAPLAPQQRIAAALARALVTVAGAGAAAVSPADPAAPASELGAPAPPGETDEQSAAVLSGLTELGVINVDGEPAARATLAVVLAPGAPPEGATSSTIAPPEQRDGLLLPFLAQLDAAGQGVVVAGSTSSAAGGGFVAAVREDGSLDGAVSTIDVADTPQGQISMLLALAEQERGGAGDYGGASEVDRVLPPEPETAPAAPVAAP